MNIAIITGVTGQDGSYLSELLLEKKYTVWGIIRKTSTPNTKRIEHILSNPNFLLKYADLTDGSSLINLFIEIRNMKEKIRRIEVYNLAAISHVKISFDVPVSTGDVDGIGVLKLLDAIRLSGLQDITRFYQASTSELYGKVHETPQTEKTPFYPRSPYGVAKLYGFWITKNYRESYNMFACNGILYNHESKRRGHDFVTRKITIGLGKILRGEEEYITLGNLNAIRDWGHARDYVYGMWLMLQADSADDYILSTGEAHSVREFIEYAFSLRKINLKWRGENENEIGYDELTNKIYIRVSPEFYRPAEVDLLLGSPHKAYTVLGWKHNISFHELIKEMVDEDCKT